MQPKEHFWSDEIMSLIEISGIKMTCRTSCTLLNRLLHRDGKETLKMKTMSEMCDRHGNEILHFQEQHMRDILAQHHFDPNTGKPQDGADTNLLQESVTASQEMVSKTIEQIDAYVASYNEHKRDGITIQMTEAQKRDIEDPLQKTVYVALDGVCVKRQKDNRENAVESVSLPEAKDAEEDLSAAPGQKKRATVETAVAHIQVGIKRYVLLADNMMSLCLHVLAFLLEFDLLCDYRLVFLTDGAKDIRTALKAVFGFRHYTVLLDWFHLRKHCTEVISMMLRAGKEYRESQYRTKRIVFRYLWCGNVQGAISYICSLTDSEIRNERKRQELLEYLGRKDYSIQCYAVRRHLGLTTTSNPVEKANDLTVARRQKKKGMSWSGHGSRGLAALTVLYLNNEDHLWHEERSLSYNMYEKYGDGLAA